MSHQPPAAVAQAAATGLRLRASMPPSRRGGTAVGIARARDLANRRPVSDSTIVRMRSYFARHAVDASAPGWGVDSKGWQAWLLWGGDAGRAWSNRITLGVQPAADNGRIVDHGGARRPNPAETFGQRGTMNGSQIDLDHYKQGHRFVVFASPGKRACYTDEAHEAAAAANSLGKNAFAMKLFDRGRRLERLGSSGSEHVADALRSGSDESEVRHNPPRRPPAGAQMDLFAAPVVASTPIDVKAVPEIVEPESLPRQQIAAGWSNRLPWPEKFEDKGEYDRLHDGGTSHMLYRHVIDDRTSRCFCIPETMWEEFDSRLAVMLKQAKRCHVEVDVITYRPFSTVWHWTTYRDEQDYAGTPHSMRCMAKMVQINAPTIKIAGWKAIAKVDHQKAGAGKWANLQFKFSADAKYDIEKFASAPPQCDHCNLLRHRASTVLVQDDQGKIKQLGMDCLTDYTGHDWSKLLNFGSVMASFEDDCDSMGESGGMFRRRATIREFMELAAKWLRTHPFISKRAAEERHEESSAEAIEFLLVKRSRGDLKDKEIEELTPVAEDVAAVEQAIEWAINLPGRSDYEFNLKAIAIGADSLLKNRHVGLATAMIAGFYRWVEDGRIERAKKADVVDPGPVGEIGERITVYVEQLGTKLFTSFYGETVLHKWAQVGTGVRLSAFHGGREFTDENGLALVDGARGWVTGTVKDHKEYRGVSETQLTRCAWSNTEPVEKKAKKRKNPEEMDNWWDELDDHSNPDEWPAPVEFRLTRRNGPALPQAPRPFHAWKVTGTTQAADHGTYQKATHYNVISPEGKRGSLVPTHGVYRFVEQLSFFDPMEGFALTAQESSRKPAPRPAILPEPQQMGFRFNGKNSLTSPGLFNTQTAILDLPGVHAPLVHTHTLKPRPAGVSVPLEGHGGRVLTGKPRLADDGTIVVRAKDPKSGKLIEIPVPPGALDWRVDLATPPRELHGPLVPAPVAIAKGSVQRGVSIYPLGTRRDQFGNPVGEARMPTGDLIEYAWRVVPLGDLIVSHDPWSLETNKAYPQVLQPRDRSRSSYADQINRLVREFDPQLLTWSATAADGAPIIGPDLVVESGNGRTMALSRVYREGTAKADAYRTTIAAWAEHLGLPEDQIARIAAVKDPVLVRLRLTDVDRAAFAREANVSGQQGMAAAEQAISDAAALTPALVGRLDPSADLSSAGNQGFVSDYIEQVAGRQARGTMADLRGKLSLAGETRIRYALFAFAYGPASHSLLPEIAEFRDSDLTAFLRGMMMAAPTLARLQADIAEGIFDAGYAVGASVSEAAHFVAAARKANAKVWTQFRQISTFPLGAAAHCWLFAGFPKGERTSGPTLTAALLRYALEVQQHPAGQMSFFDSPPPQLELIGKAVAAAVTGDDDPPKGTAATEIGKRMPAAVAEALPASWAGVVGAGVAQAPARAPEFFGGPVDPPDVSPPPPPPPAPRSAAASWARHWLDKGWAFPQADELGEPANWVFKFITREDAEHIAKQGENPDSAGFYGYITAVEGNRAEFTYIAGNGLFARASVPLSDNKGPAVALTSLDNDLPVYIRRATIAQWLKGLEEASYSAAKTAIQNAIIRYGEDRVRAKIDEANREFSGETRPGFSDTDYDKMIDSYPGAVALIASGLDGKISRRDLNDILSSPPKSEAVDTDADGSPQSTAVLAAAPLSLPDPVNSIEVTADKKLRWPYLAAVTAASVTATAAQLLEAFDAFTARLPEIEDALTAAWRKTGLRSADKIRGIVSELTERAMFRFSPAHGGMVSYSMDAFSKDNDYKKAKISGHRKAVASQTDETLAAWRDSVAKKRADFDDPLSLLHIENVIKTKGIEALTPEQLAIYDADSVARSRAYRERNAAQRAVVRPVMALEGATVVEGWHTKHNRALWVVVLPLRIDGDEFKALASKARQLGGQWQNNARFTGGKTPSGFNFDTADGAARFASLVGGESVSTEEDWQEAQESSREAGAAHLREVAEDMIRRAKGEISRDRLENTWRRADMATTVRQNAKALQALGETTLRVANAIENNHPALSGIRHVTQVAELRQTLRSASYLWARANDVRHDEAPEITDPRILTAVRYPWPEIWNHDVRRLAEKMAVKAGSKRFGAKLLKMFRVDEDDRSTLKNHELIEELADAARNFRSYGLSRWDVANIREAILRYMRLWSANIRTDSELREACRAFQALYQAPAGESEIGKLTRELIGRNIPGFFPTPPPVIDRMVAAAELKPGQRVLEPSAGKGDIADAIREAEPEARLEVVEPAYSLRQILELKGFSLVGDDFMMLAGEWYDRILMNPPFEHGADIDHVRHAFDLLAPGGRLVAIMSEGPFFRSDRKAEAFRQWLESVDGHSEKLPDGSFAGKDAFRQTGVATRLVTIEKATP